MQSPIAARDRHQQTRRGRPSSAGRAGRDRPSRRAGSRAGSPPASQLVLGPADEPGHRLARRRALGPGEPRRLVGELGRAARPSSRPSRSRAVRRRPGRHGSLPGARERAPARPSRAGRSHGAAVESGGRTAASARTRRGRPRSPRPRGSAAASPGRSAVSARRPGRCSRAAPDGRGLRGRGASGRSRSAMSRWRARSCPSTGTVIFAGPKTTRRCVSPGGTRA